MSFPSAGAQPTLDLNDMPGDGSSAGASADADGQAAGASVTARISDSAAAVGTYPDGWTTFTVVISNSSADDVEQVVPLVVFGSCTCDPSTGVPPRSLLQLYTPMTGKWASAADVSVNAAGSYSFERQATPATLGAHESLTYEFRVILLGKQAGSSNGTGSIDVYVMQQPGHTRITDATGPDASLALTYDVR